MTKKLSIILNKRIFKKRQPQSTALKSGASAARDGGIYQRIRLILESNIMNTWVLRHALSAARWFKHRCADINAHSDASLLNKA
jgi:hypothetical protein